MFQLHLSFKRRMGYARTVLAFARSFPIQLSRCLELPHILLCASSENWLLSCWIYVCFLSVSTSSLSVWCPITTWKGAATWPPSHHLLPMYLLPLNQSVCYASTSVPRLYISALLTTSCGFCFHSTWSIVSLVRQSGCFRFNSTFSLAHHPPYHQYFHTAIPSLTTSSPLRRLFNFILLLLSILIDDICAACYPSLCLLACSFKLCTWPFESWVVSSTFPFAIVVAIRLANLLQWLLQCYCNCLLNAAFSCGVVHSPWVLLGIGK